MEKLTVKQEEVLQTIKKFIAENGYPPTIREIGKELNITSTAPIHFHIKNLVEKGYLKKGTKNRDLKLLIANEFMDEKSDIARVPFIDIDTKNIIKDLRNPKRLFSLPINLINDRPNTFVIQVKNQNISKYGIQDNDVLIVEKKITANNNDIAVILSTDKKILIKKCLKEDNRSYFTDDNCMNILISDFIILGKVIGLYRTF